MCHLRIRPTVQHWNSGAELSESSHRFEKKKTKRQEIQQRIEQSTNSTDYIKTPYKEGGNIYTKENPSCIADIVHL